MYHYDLSAGSFWYYKSVSDGNPIGQPTFALIFYVYNSFYRSWAFLYLILLSNNNKKIYLLVSEIL